MNAVTHQTITAGTANATNIVITDIIGTMMERANSQGTLVPVRAAVFFIKVISGTVQFGVGSIDANAKGWTSSDVIPPLTCGLTELYFKASGGSDTFVIGG